MEEDAAEIMIWMKAGQIASILLQNFDLQNDHDGTKLIKVTKIGMQRMTLITTQTHYHFTQIDKLIATQTRDQN